MSNINKIIKYNQYPAYVLASAGTGKTELIARKVEELIINEKVDADYINEESFKDYLTTSKMPDLDLLVRTSGEQRISGFMLYNMAYAELYFVKKHWPEFKAKDLDDCVLEFQKRNRRFGE